MSYKFVYITMAAALMVLVAAPFASPSLAGGAIITGRASVIDGDTIEIHGNRIRFSGIDAPESHQRCEDAHGKRYLCGGDAANALDAFLAASRPTSCTVVDHDKYGRSVADCSRADGKSAQSFMVSTGHALDWPRYDRAGRFAADQTAAKAAHAGVWQGRFIEPWHWRRGDRRLSAATDASAKPPAPHTAEAIAASGPQTCGVAKTCHEGVVLWCGGYANADRDNDGIPCENVCRSRAEVETIETAIGCHLKPQ